jgi:hypothetical protein
MFEIHRAIGEGLFLLYLIVFVVILALGRRGGTPPSWLVGLSHGILALQVAIGVILLAEDPDRVVWYHPVLGILALLALGLTPVIRQRLRGAMGVAGVFAIVALLTLAARLAVL